MGLLSLSLSLSFSLTSIVIQRWLLRTGVAPAAAPVRAHGATGSSGDPAPGTRQADGGSAPEAQVAAWRSPGAPGSSTAPPRAAEALVLAGPPFSSRRARVPALAVRAELGGPLRGAVVGAGTTVAVGGGHALGRWAKVLG